MMRDKNYKKISETDIIKAIAVLAVIWQGVLNLVAGESTTIREGVVITMIFNLVKFSAPAFIFAICFDLSRVRGISYKEQIKHKAKELLIPYFIWSTIYIGTMNNLNYGREYVQAYLFGTGAGHLWYTVMMFQFQLLVPIIWLLYKKFLNNKRNIIITLFASTIFFLIWIWVYNKFNLNLAQNKILLYTDRLFISYSIYGVLGIVASAIYDKWKTAIYKCRHVIIVLWIGGFALINYEMLNTEFLEKVNLHNITYLKPSMFLYNVVTILVLYLVAIILIRRSRSILPMILFVSKYAFRAYLANSFCLQVVSKLMGNIVWNNNFILNMVMLFMLITILSFSLVFSAEYICKYIKQKVMIRKIDSSSIVS